MYRNKIWVLLGLMVRFQPLLLCIIVIGASDRLGVYSCYSKSLPGMLIPCRREKSSWTGYFIFYFGTCYN